MNAAKAQGKQSSILVEALSRFSAISLLLGMSLVSNSVGAENGSPTYSGDFLKRSTLTGDWGGARNELAVKGITADLSLTQVEQGVVGGGKDHTWEYGGRGDLTVNADTQKLGWWPGGLLTMDLQGNVSRSVNNNTGAIMPVNSNQLYPLPNGDNLNIAQLSITQSLSSYVGLIIGKIETFADANEFAGGLGDTQFLNNALTADPVTSLVTPFSTLGAAVNISPTTDPNEAIVTFSVLQTNGNAKTSGFNNLDANKLTFAGEGRVGTDFLRHTGHQLLGVEYSNETFTSLGQNLRFIVVNNTVANKDRSWDVYYNFDQYLYEPNKASGQGVGIFGRLGASDGNPNPVQYFYSLGVGGKGIIPRRPNDEFGLGYYYIKVSNITLQGQASNGISVNLSLLRNEYGFEAYYKIALTPWMLLTPDLQIIRPAQKQQKVDPFGLQGINTAKVLGVRLQLLF
ncbi:MAG TPA: carbohydrate porin [Burkholderiales bacterium]|nr:carbohydrate porin [Burkholderiales bacterium]